MCEIAGFLELRERLERLGHRFRTGEGAMQIIRERLKVVTDRKQQFFDLTKQVRDVLKRHSARDGILLLNTLHTTTALFINEVQPALLADLENLMAKLVRERESYFHNDPHYSDCDRGNATAHLRATLFGNNVALGVSDGELILGPFQGIIFAELDGPRERILELQLMSLMVRREIEIAQEAGAGQRNEQ